MALTRSPVTVVSVSLLDAQNKKSSMEMSLPNTILMSTIVSSLTTTILPAVVLLTNASVAGWSISNSAQDPDVTAQTASEDSNVSEKLVFSCKADNGQDVRVSVPSPLGAAIMQGTDLADETHPGIIAMRAALIDSGLFDTSGATSNIGSPIASVRQIKFGTRR